MKVKKLQNLKVFSIIVLIVASAAGWAFYSLINQLAHDILESFKITNIYTQNAIVIVFALILLFLFGFGISKAIDKIISK